MSEILSLLSSTPDINDIVIDMADGKPATINLLTNLTKTLSHEEFISSMTILDSLKIYGSNILKIFYEKTNGNSQEFMSYIELLETNSDTIRETEDFLLPTPRTSASLFSRKTFTTLDIIITMSKGNPCALSILNDLLSIMGNSDFCSAMRVLDQNKIYGSDIVCQFYGDLKGTTEEKKAKKLQEFIIFINSLKIDS